MTPKPEQSRQCTKDAVSEPESLSIHRSFLVRLHSPVHLQSGEISGLVEHVVSGEAQEFSSVAELLTSIGTLLGIDKVAE